MDEGEQWEAMMYSIRKAARILNIDLTEEDLPEYMNWVAGRHMYRELWAQVYSKTQKKKSSIRG